MEKTIDVLECNSGTAKKSGKAYNIALVRVDGRVGKIFSKVALPIENDVDVVFSISPNQEMFLSLGIEKLAD